MIYLTILGLLLPSICSLIYDHNIRRQNEKDKMYIAEITDDIGTYYYVYKQFRWVKYQVSPSIFYSYKAAENWIKQEQLKND